MPSRTFQDAYRLAVESGDTRPLADYVAEAVSLTAHERRLLANLLRDLRPRYQGERGKSKRTDRREHVFRLSRHIAIELRDWCVANNRIRVPLDKKKELIEEEIDARDWPETWQRDRHWRQKLVDDVEELLKNPARLLCREQRPKVLPRRRRN
jgi:hypothetical protein